MDTVERLLVVPGARYDQHVLLTDYLRCLPSEVRTKLVDEAYVEQHNFASFSKKVLDIEAKLGSVDQSQGDGRKKRLFHDWKKKGQLMFVDHNGQATKIDDFPDLGEDTEHDGASETSDGGVVAPIKEKARGTGKKNVGQSTGQGDQRTPAWVKLGLEYEVWRDRVAREAKLRLAEVDVRWADVRWAGVSIGGGSSGGELAGECRGRSGRGIPRGGGRRRGGDRRAEVEVRWHPSGEEVGGGREEIWAVAEGRWVKAERRWQEKAEGRWAEVEARWASGGEELGGGGEEMVGGGREEMVGGGGGEMAGGGGREVGGGGKREPVAESRWAARWTESTALQRATASPCNGPYFQRACRSRHARGPTGLTVRISARS
ncbi:hypothetical protein CBR_g28893 [Chara braunii]|uniref:Uncharacterized protein n=1 Tax=Chara braunii TaxID=69332 RepID=A0A388LA34_CHABU|nr:hypothetical protein CBR_g28893 [Chara braunii]|eukprot:GBG79177.1 hypothetical protein CBR_g28893 [Chara braunii]